MQLYVGTSGYSYKEWVGAFYPAGSKPDQWLAYYSGKLPAVEINNTFYRTPDADVVAKWAGTVPASFRFAVKASRRITHQKRLADPAESVSYFMERLSPFGKRLGCVLYQMPPNAKVNLERLTEFLKAVPKNPPIAFEFRNSSWFTEEVFALLRKKKAALVYSDGESTEMPFIATANWGYLRLRDDNMTLPDVKRWAKRVSEMPWKQAFVFFKHEDEGRGAELAAAYIKASQELGART